MNADLRGLLNEIAGDCRVAYGVTEESYRAYCRNGAVGAFPADTWAAHCQRRLGQIEQALASLSVAQGQGWVPVSERMPPDDVMVLVYWTEEGEDRYDFEATEEGVWIKHAEHYDNYLSVALPENSRGPSEQAPYTHWRTVKAPAGPAERAA